MAPHDAKPPFAPPAVPTAPAAKPGTQKGSTITFNHRLRLLNAASIRAQTNRTRTVGSPKPRPISLPPTPWDKPKDPE